MTTIAPGMRIGKSFEYEFVRLREYRGSALFGVRHSARETYQQVVHEHAREGWRLVQIFAPAPPLSAPPGTTT